MPPYPAPKQTPAQYLKTLSTVHIALIAGQVLFAALAVALNKKILINVRFTDDPLVVIVPIAAVCGFVASQSLYSQKLKYMSEMQPLSQKLKDYQTALILRFAALEAPSLFGITAFLLTGILFFLLIALLIIGWFIYIKPTRQKVITALGLSFEDQQSLS